MRLYHHHLNGHRLRLRKLFLCLIIITFVNCAESIKCKDESGNDVDWFIVYKLPKSPGSSDPHTGQGLGYAYILPGNEDWQVSSGKGISDPESLVGRTLQPLFHEDTNTTSNLAYILYNDQPPQGPTMFSNGHTKGIILTNAQEGIWLQHSVPHFLNLTSKKVYNYPRTGQHNGQIFHCLSLEVSQVDNVGNILNITKPHVYDYMIPDQVAKSLPILSKVVKKPNKEFDFNLLNDNVTSKHEYQFKKKRSEENSKIIQIRNAGRILYSFAKGPTFNEEIYSAWIAPKFQTELDVQSWLNGPNAYPSNCSSSAAKVYNIEDISLSVKFSTHNDHSKWAIAIQKPVVCIGDLNRMEHQTKRGGTVNCFMEKGAWKAFKKIVTGTQPCAKP